MNQPIINIDNLTVKFETVEAVKSISFSIPEGEIRGLLGGNGAGKSTTMATIAGILPPTTGIVEVAGIRNANYKSANSIKALTGYCPDVGGLISSATPIEHLRLVATLYKNPEIYNEGIQLLDELELTNSANAPTGGFSHGMQRRLSVLLAYLTAEKALILDEPYDGVDPFGVEIINTFIRNSAQKGLAIIVSTHLQHLLAEISDNITVMDRGQIVTTLPAEQLAGEEGRKLYVQLLKDSRAGTLSNPTPTDTLPTLNGEGVKVGGAVGGIAGLMGASLKSSNTPATPSVEFNLPALFDGETS